MGRSAMSKLADAAELDKQSDKLKKRDPESARQLEEMARSKRRRAIRQMKQRPRKRKESLVV